MDDERRKLELVVKTADAIWGGVELKPAAAPGCSRSRR